MLVTPAGTVTVLINQTRQKSYGNKSDLCILIQPGSCKQAKPLSRIFFLVPLTN